MTPTRATRGDRHPVPGDRAQQTTYWRVVITVAGAAGWVYLATDGPWWWSLICLIAVGIVADDLARTVTGRRRVTHPRYLRWHR